MTFAFWMMLVTACALFLAGYAAPLAITVLAHAALTRFSSAPFGTGEAQPSKAARALWGLPSFVSLLVVLCVYFALLTRGTGVLIGPEMLSGSFDSLAQGFWRGTAEVDPATIRWEAFTVDGRAYLYFGPWPALLRMPLLWLGADWFGNWARLSCFVAGTVALSAFTLLAARMLTKNSALGAAEKRFFLATSIVGFGLATPLAFLMNAASIYHESIAWGLAGSMCFLAIALPRLDAPASLRRCLPMLAAVAGATFLARVTYGAPLYLILLGIAARELARERASRAPELGREVAKLTAALLPAGALLLFHLWYNVDRFGSPFTFVDYKLMSIIGSDSATLALLDETGVFNVRRLLAALSNYIVPSTAFVSNQFPWFELGPPRYPDTGLYPRIFSSFIVPLSMSSSWLLLGALVGGGYAFGTKGQRLLRFCFFAFAFEALLVCSYYIMELRYELDIVPVLVFAYALFLANVSLEGPLKGRAQDVATVLMFTVAVSVIVTVSSTLSAIPRGGPAHSTSYKAEWQERFDAVNAVMPGGER